MRFRSNSYGLPASSLLLLAWRLKKISRVTAGLQSRESVRTMFLPGVENHDRGTKNDARQPETTAGATQNKRAPGRNRARDHPLQRQAQDHRATETAAGPRAPAGHARARGPDLESAEV